MITNEESAPPSHPTSQTAGGSAPLSWKKLFDAIEDGVCAQSLDSRIVCANGAFANIIGKPLEEIIGRPCAEVFGCASETGLKLLESARPPTALDWGCLRSSASLARAAGGSR